MNKQNQNYLGFSWMQGLIHPPFSWLYRASSFQHDENYSKGGTKEDRLKADVGFFWRMLQDANQLPYKQKKKAVRTAIIYYILVRLFGWISWK